jgi:hypothetical protein
LTWAILKARNDLNIGDNDRINKKKMSYASSGRKMKFFEDFYALTVVSYIYYEEDQKIRAVKERKKNKKLHIDNSRRLVS